MPLYDIKQLGTLRVSVVPASIESVVMSRASTRHSVAIDIGIQKMVGPDIETDIETLTSIVDEICLYVKRLNLDTTPAAKFVDVQNDPIYSIAHIDGFQTFTSVLHMRYVVFE